jgi:hypothetical protein
MIKNNHRQSRFEGAMRPRNLSRSLLINLLVAEQRFFDYGIEIDL